VTKPNTKQPIDAPVAPRRPHSFTVHGITVVDDYAWLKDPEWQEVLRDPDVLDADIRKYLEAENDYTESLLGHTADLQKNAGRRDARPNQGRRFQRARGRRSLCLYAQIPRGR
jgi:protease II